MTATLANPYGRSTWTDITDNWRKADADWLQDRIILRYASTLPSLAQGQVVYQASTDNLVYQGSAAVRTVLSSAKASIVDSGNNAGMVNSLAGSGGISLVSDGSVNFPTKAVTGSVSGNRVELDSIANTGRISIVGATGTFTLTVANSRMQASGGLYAPTLVGDTVTVNSGGALNVVGSATFSSTATFSQINATGISIGSGTFSATGGLVSAATVQGTLITLGSGGLVPISGSNQKVEFTGNEVVITSTTGPRMKVGANSAPLAGWTTSSVAPTAGDSAWPNGTVWFVV